MSFANLPVQEGKVKELSKFKWAKKVPLWEVSREWTGSGSKTNGKRQAGDVALKLHPAGGSELQVCGGKENKEKKLKEKIKINV